MGDKIATWIACQVPLATLLRLSTSAAPTANATLTVSVVIPCLNEAESIAECVTRARSAMEGAGISGEVVVADNGSTDGSP
ncbi:MAG: glycosyltransferase, partial [Thermoleophilaceae bacterium]|nr:glycosyltransferase [Thermoleophilaceae bacterium]